MNVKAIGILFLALTFGMTSCVSKKKFNELEEEKMQMEESLAQLNSKVEELLKENEGLAESNEQLEAKVSSVETQLDQTEAKVERVESDLKKSNQELQGVKTDLADAFGAASKAAQENEASIREMEDRLYLDVEDGIHFTSGSASLSSSDMAAIDKLATMLKDNPGLNLIIEGHTDNVPLGDNAEVPYTDNWELSVARSVSIVRKLISKGVNPEQLMAAGSAEYHAIGDNSTVEGRKANRRGDVLIIPNLGKLYKRTVEP